MNIKKLVYFSIGPLGGAFLSLITVPFVAWFFSVEDVGRLTMLQVILSLSVALFSLAMHQAYVREYHEVADKPLLFKICIIPGFIFLSLTCLVILFLPLSISNLLFGIESQYLTFLLVVSIFCSLFINFFSHVVRMEERGLAFSLTQITPKLLLILFIGSIPLMRLNAEFITLMHMSSLSIVITFFVFCWVTRDTWIKSINSSVDYSLLRRTILFSLPLVVGGISYWALTTIDRFFIRSISGFEELGVFSLAVTIAGSVAVISTIFSNIWHPILYRWVKDGVDLVKLQKIVDFMMLLITFIWSFLGVFSFLLPYFFPTDYAGIEYLLLPCAAVPLFYMFSQVTSVGIGVTRKSTLSMSASIIALLVNCILNMLLVPLKGASGAALATLLSFFIFFIIRTEASAFIWYGFPRHKLYLLLVLYVLATIVFVLTAGAIQYFFVVWLSLISLTCILYRVRVAELLSLFKSFIKRYSRT